MSTKAPSTSFMLISVDNDKGTIGFYASVSKDHISKGLNAVDWMKSGVVICGGKGGGKPNLAQGQGKDLTKYEEGVKSATDFIQKIIPK